MANDTDALLIIWTLLVLTVFLPLVLISDLWVELILSAGIVWGAGIIVIITWRQGE